MHSISLPPDLEAWARAEVAAGRAASVAELVERSVRERRQFDAFRRSLEKAEAEAERDGARPAADVFAELKARYPVS